MKVSRLFAPSTATLFLLLAASSAASQTMQRSMVYRVQPTQPATQTSPRTQEVSTNNATSASVRSSVKNQVSVRQQAASSAQPRVVKISHVASAMTPNRATPTRTTNASVAAPRVASLAKSSVTTARPARTTAATTVGHTAAQPANAAATTSAVPAHLRMDGREVPAKRRFDKWFLASSALFAVGTIMDHQSTVAGMKKAGAREANPLLRNSDGGFSPGKHFALSAGVYGASLMLQRKHPKMANVLRIIGGAAKIGVAIHNRSAARGR